MNRDHFTGEIGWLRGTVEVDDACTVDGMRLIRPSRDNGRGNYRASMQWSGFHGAWGCSSNAASRSAFARNSA